MRKKKRVIKRKVVLVGTIVLVGIVLFGFWFYTRPTLKILSFERYFDGQKVVSILHWDYDKKVKEYAITVYDEDYNVALEVTTNDHEVDLADAVFEEDARFMVEVVAKEKNGRTTKSNLYSTTWKKEINKVAPVKSSRESGTVQGRKTITLTTKTPEAEIYYTIDGSDPALNGKLYQEPIALDQTMLLSTIAVRDGYQDSDVSSYSYEVTSLDPVIYLSPSTQEYNSGIRGSGYTTEEEMMNKVADVVEEKLKKHHFTVYRNKPTMTAGSSASDSLKKDVDLHLAIHSNASPEGEEGEYIGVETWIYDQTCTEAKAIAEKLQEAVFSVYYNRYGNRGVLYSVDIGGLRETNPAYVHNGILIELAFHDNWNDAVWIVRNIDKIGTVLADALIDYYQKE